MSTREQWKAAYREARASLKALERANDDWTAAGCPREGMPARIGYAERRTWNTANRAVTDYQWQLPDGDIASCLLDWLIQDRNQGHRPATGAANYRAQLELARRYRAPAPLPA